LKKSKEKQLTAKQNKCIELLVYGGLTQHEAAEILQVGESTISMWKRSDLFIQEYDAEIERSRGERRRLYNIKANSAVTKLAELLNCGDLKVEFNTAKEIIRLAGDEPVSDVHVTLDDDGFIEALGKAAKTLDWSDDV